MNPRLQRLIDEVKGFSRNPEGFAPRVELLSAITESGESFSEDDMLEAGREIGVPDDELVDFLQEHAAWLGGSDMIADPKPRPNPDPEEPEDDDDDDGEGEDYCDCEDGCEEHEQCPDCKMCKGCCCECED